jgi:NDP-sugar pyrophosphorylase family protein
VSLCWRSSKMRESGTRTIPTLALLAGGLATRLRPITATIPKSMVTVAGKPFIAHQLRVLAREGVNDVVICSGHLGEQIMEFVGDGAKYGCRVRFSPDGDHPLGTGGALRRALPLLGDHFMVMYGDSYLDTNFRRVSEAFDTIGLPALMTVFRNEGRFDASNVEFAGGRIVRYDKVNRTPAMRFIDYGLSLLKANIVEEQPPNVAFDLADLYCGLADRQMLAGYEVHERFYEIGSPDGLAETDAQLRGLAAVALKSK